MATEDQLIMGLKAADAAGNTVDAQHFADQIKALRASSATASTPQSSGIVGTIADMARSVPGGLAKGISGLAGLPGDINSLMSAGSDKIMQFMGESPENIQRMQQIRQNIPLAAPTSGALNEAVSKPFGGYYEPKTMAGQYTQTAASFAPNALMPGSAMARAARVLVPSTASETAGQLAKNYAPDYEQLARAAGGLAGGIGEGIGEAALGPTQKLPSIADVKKEATAAYNVVDNSGMEISQPAMKTLEQQVKLNLKGLGFDDTNIDKLAPKTSAALSSLDTASTAPSSLQGLEMQRRIAGLAASAPEKTDRMAARVIQDTIDDFVKNIGPQHVTGTIDQAAMDALGTARDAWGRSARAQLIQDTMDKAGMKMGGQSVFSPTLDQSLRTKFGTLAGNARAMARFSPEEQDAIRQVATGGNMTSARNLLTNVGRLSPQSVIPAMAEGAAVMHNPSYAVLPAVGFGSRVGATAMTKSAANDALVKVLMRGQVMPAAKSTAQVITPAVLAAVLSQSGAQ